MAAASAPENERLLERSSSYEFLPPQMSELRVVLLGNSWSERSSVGNLLLEGTVFNNEVELDQFVTVRGQIKEKHIVLINTPDLLNPNISEDKLREHLENCVRLSDPGPHVFLLVLQPEDFTEEHELRICRVLELFSDQSLDHSMVLISPKKKSQALWDIYIRQSPIQEMIRRCGFRSLRLKYLELPELLRSLKDIIEKNKGNHLICHHHSLKQKEKSHVNMDNRSSDDQPPKHSSSFEDLRPFNQPPGRSKSSEFLPPPIKPTKHSSSFGFLPPDNQPPGRSKSSEFLPPPRRLQPGSSLATKTWGQPLHDQSLKRSRSLGFMQNFL